MKYVVFDTCDGLEQPFIFSELFNHSDVVQCIQSVYAGFKVVSAGFCRFVEKPEGGMDIHCWGKSVTLNVGCREFDDELLRRTNEFHG